MTSTSSRCPHCGAPMNVAATAKSAKCEYCHAVTQSVQTEPVDQKNLLDEVKSIKFDQALAELERDWERRRRSYMSYDKYGAPEVPTRAGAVVGMLFGVGFGVALLIVLLTTHVGAFLPFSIAMIVFSLYGGVASLCRASLYEEAEMHYKQSRIELLGQYSRR